MPHAWNFPAGKADAGGKHVAGQPEPITGSYLHRHSPAHLALPDSALHTAEPHITLVEMQQGVFQWNYQTDLAAISE